MAAVYASPTLTLQSPARAQVFAWYDFIKRELPDVFLTQSVTSSTNYPISFAAQPYGLPSPPLGSGNDLDYMLPLGSGVSPPGEGVYGASYFAAAGLYKNIGYMPAGYDGVDNDGNGLIDEWAEGVNAPPSYTVSPPSPTNPTLTVQQVVQGNLNLHQHHTARAEMLYAILVEGVGPLGSAFSPDDFTDREVQDTDGDGLPEFVDAWGQPLQFFRWPLLYHTDSQKGQVVAYWDYTQTPPASSASPLYNPPYLSVFDAREQDPLDPNQQLMAPAWWSSSSNGTNYFYHFPGLAQSTPGIGASFGVNAFEFFFHRLTEPISPAGGNQYWDRGTTYGSRRAFSTRPLILSGGPDKQLGVFHYPDTPYPETATISAAQLLMVENNAMPFANDFTNSSTTMTTKGYTIPAGPPLTPITPDTYSYDTNAQTSFGLQESGKDDISNLNRQASIGAGGP
jgi:hypothetical protein